jgi:hypothetical protein
MQPRGAPSHFHITKASPWPKGKYTLRLLLDGREVETETFTVK